MMADTFWWRADMLEQQLLDDEDQVPVQIEKFVFDGFLVAENDFLVKFMATLVLTSLGIN